MKSESPIDDMSPPSVGEHLRRLRKTYGLTQRELATQSGLSFSFINQVERGKESVRLDALNRLADVFGYTVALVKRSSQPDSASS